MGITMETLKRWFQRGVEQEATHLIVVCDTFDWEDYPVYVTKEQNVHEVEEHYKNSSMQKVMEVYNLKMDMDTQMAEHRSWNY